MTQAEYDLLARVLGQARATAASTSARHEVDRITIIFVGALSKLDSGFDSRRFNAMAHGHRLSADHPA